MTKRICWKKGMRLTDEILRASDESTFELMGHALVLAATGRFGLFPSAQPFELSLNITQGIVDVVSLDCLGITKGGHLIDVHYDSKFTNAFNIRIPIPEGTGEKVFMLTVTPSDGRWRDTNDGFEVPEYTFALMAQNSPLPPNSLPIARIVNDHGWHHDEVDFLPPCLFVSSHRKYGELLRRFSDLLKAIDAKACKLKHSVGKDAVRIFWPVVQQLMITANKECDTLTPMQLLANIQKCASAFLCACALDEVLELTDEDRFRNFVYAPYDYQNAYQLIRQGLDLCYAISEKVEKMAEAQIEDTPTAVAAPTIEASQLQKRCTSNKTRVVVTNNAPGATVYYTTDGSMPTQSSASGTTISLDNGFENNRRREPDKIVVVKVMACLDGATSAVNKYEITLQKDISAWMGKVI